MIDQNDMIRKDMQENISAYFDAADAIGAGTATPNQTLVWLVSLSETWVRESRKGESVVFSQQG